MAPFTVTHGCKRNRSKRSVEVYFYHSAVHNYRDNHRQNFQTPAYNKGFQCQRHQFANRHCCHCRLHLHGKRTNINGGIATDNAGGRIYHRLPNVKYRHCNIERMADEIDRDPHLHEILEEHPCVYIVQIVPLRQHRNQFVAKDQRNDDSCNRNHHRIRNVTDHAENTAVPPLRCLPDLSSDLTGLLVDRREHRTQVGLHHAGKKFPHPFFDCCENIIEQWRVFLLSLVD